MTAYGPAARPRDALVVYRELGNLPGARLIMRRPRRCCLATPPCGLSGRRLRVRHSDDPRRAQFGAPPPSPSNARSHGIRPVPSLDQLSVNFRGSEASPSRDLPPDLPLNCPCQRPSDCSTKRSNGGREGSTSASNHLNSKDYMLVVNSSATRKYHQRRLLKLMPGATSSTAKLYGISTSRAPDCAPPKRRLATYEGPD